MTEKLRNDKQEELTALGRTPHLRIEMWGTRLDSLEASAALVEREGCAVQLGSDGKQHVSGLMVGAGGGGEHLVPAGALMVTEACGLTV
jgi:hypothetical protein